MNKILSAIVIIVDNDVHSVYIVPAEQASIDNMSKLRMKIRSSGINGIRVQRVWYSDTNSNIQNINDISKRLEEVLDNYAY